MDVFGVATGELLEIVGVLLVIGGVLSFFALRGRIHWAMNVTAIVAGGLLFFGGAWVAAAMVGGGPAPNAPPTAGVLVQLASSPGLLAGETWNSITNTMTVDVVYNTSTNAWMVQNVLTGVASHPNWVNLPLKLVRSDAINATYAFPVSVTSIPTFNSLGTNPTTYSFVGYTSATSTSPGIWQVFFSAGTLANQKPTVSAPGVATNVLNDPCAVNAFNSLSPILKVSLGGGNSTSAPTLSAEAVQNYTTYPMTIGIGQGSPSGVTLDFIPIGWHS